MSEVWRVTYRDNNHNGLERTHDHQTEEAAMRHAEKLAKKGQMAVVYPIGGVEE